MSPASPVVQTRHVESDLVSNRGCNSLQMGCMASLNNGCGLDGLRVGLGLDDLGFDSFACSALGEASFDSAGLVRVGKVLIVESGV